MLQYLLTPVNHDWYGNYDGNWYFPNFSESLLYALIGFLVVFLGIVLIIFIIWLLGLIMRKTDNLAFLTRKKNKSKAELQEAETVQEPVTAVADSKPEIKNNDGITDEERAAVIAAVIACLQEEKSDCEFVVKRIRRI